MFWTDVKSLAISTATLRVASLTPKAPGHRCPFALVWFKIHGSGLRSLVEPFEWQTHNLRTCFGQFNLVHVQFFRTGTSDCDPMGSEKIKVAGDGHTEAVRVEYDPKEAEPQEYAPP